MAIHWPLVRRSAVESILHAYLKESGQCAQAAKEIMPHATDQDNKAIKWKIRPKLGHGRCLAPRASVGEKPWFFHVFVETEFHTVDGLTGIDGTPADDYLSAHFDHPDFIKQVRA